MVTEKTTGQKGIVMKYHSFKNMPVLVTGGAGFIGSHLVEQLVLAGAKVTVLDDCSTGTVHNLAHIQNSFTLMRASIVDFQTCYQAVQDMHAVFHLAAYVSVPLSLEYPLECYARNIQGTLNMLEACRQANVQRFIFSSSASVYGSQNALCYEAMPCTPESPYGYSKWVAELLCQQYALCFGLKTVSLRYFNVYGERQNTQGVYAGVVAKFKECLKNNEPITIFGDGLQTRDFVPVQQVVQANMQFALAPDSCMRGLVYNIATGKSITILELVALLKKEYPDYDKPLVFAPARQGDLVHSAADCTAYHQLQQEGMLTYSEIKFYGTTRFVEVECSPSVGLTKQTLLPTEKS